jgi:phospholipase C
LWNSTALIITYDEHGGFFDHVAPPSTNVPNPDGINSVDDPFDFTRLGIRIPTVVVSPWVEKGSVIHAKPEGEGQYEHSSFPATIVHKLFSAKLGFPEAKYQNNRDAWAATFESVFMKMPVLREDCPLTMPVPSNHANITALPPMDGSLKLTDLQKHLLLLAAGVTEDKSFRREWVDMWTESQAGSYVTARMTEYLDLEM